MKPGEFDELVRQKFDQNDFEYNPKGWDKLAEEMDGRSKKRGLMILWMPLMGVAASVALAFGVSAALQLGTGNISRNAAGHHYSHNTNVPSNMPKQAAQSASASALDTVLQQLPESAPENASLAGANIPSAISAPHSDPFAMRMDHIVPATRNNSANRSSKHNLLAQDIAGTAPKFATITDEEVVNKKKKNAPQQKAVYTFKEDKKEGNYSPKTAIILSGGLSFGSQTSGYTVGASARRMVSDRVYVEGDIAFVGASNTQKVQYVDKSSSSTVNAAIPSSYTIAARSSVTGKNSSDALPSTSTNNVNEVIRTGTTAYNLYYAQVTPTIGYKILKRLSVGAGPDFQQVLVDNRPAPSTVDRGNLKEAPMFDIGFMGKTEYAVSPGIKAAIYYREGINNIITPTNKYIDRNYLQLQIKCTIFNK